ncbi:hypothetical protein K227x_38350 [Rubripirellula lacrimiformis]|uniref:Sulfatase n=1 Tax=Rubripirellula lacrimiformis TaxID=1930273 RepID=A0A517NE76_9BACT|nr:DUF1501 domain-containing protein [Rubripirellula lacrimiformis]QDT05435.1 hypothetical protein K227x_38350 [Rubripirellula lacrimiformis]
MSDSRIRDMLARRRFLTQTTQGIGYAALGSLLGPDRSASAIEQSSALPRFGGAAGIPHFPPKVERVIYMHMVGGPSQMDLFDYKPQMEKWYDKDLPESVRDGQRLTTMTSGQNRFPIAPSKYKFQQHGESGMWVSELLPHTAKMVDEMAFVRSMHTEAINHEPAISFIQTGNQVTGRPCLGSWTSYGLGSLNQNLPTFVVLVAQPSNREQLQAISGRLWGSGYLPGKHAGVSFRSQGDPILFLNNPDGVPAEMRRETLDTISRLNSLQHQAIRDPETATRIEQYEMAFRMQASVPDLVDLSTETKETIDLYGDAALQPGTFANSALLARRLTENGVRFVQIYHNNWDNHSNVGGRLPSQCNDVDKPCAGLIQDLKNRGLLDSTLVIWGGEFGRTIYSQGKLSHENYGRDHHPRCFTMWMAGGGVKPGTVYGETDDFSYNIVKDPVHIRDLHATVLQLMGIDHQRFTYKYLGLDQKLTGVEPARVISDLIA